ncbi:unnamed protein product [Closterium sp. NIES-54]
MASLCVLAFDHEGRPIQFDTWLDDLQLYLMSESKDSVSLFDHTSAAAPAPPATADSATRSQWLTLDAAARLAIRNHLPLAECAHFGQHRTAQALYDTVVARYSSPATVALGRLLLPYLFPELSAFATVEDLVSHLCTSDARYRTAVPAEFLDRNQPPMFITLYFIVTYLPDSLRSVRDHFFTLDPTVLIVDLLEKHLLAAETSIVAVGAARGTPRKPFFEGCSPSPLAPSYASAAAVDVLGAEDVGAASASGKRRNSKGKGGRGGGGGNKGGGGGSSGGVSLVDTLLGVVPVEVAVDSGTARGAASGGAEPGGAEPGGAEPGGAGSEGAGSWGAEPGGAEPGGAELAGVEPGGAECEGVEPGGAESGGAESGGAEPRGTASSGGPAGASPRLSPRQEPLSPQQLCEWFTQRTSLRSGAARAGDSAAGDTGARGSGVTAGAGGTGGAAAAGPGGARTRGTGAAGTGSVGGDGAGDPTEPGVAGSRGTGAGGAGAGGARVVGARAGGTGAGGAGVGGSGARGVVSGGTGAGGTPASPLPAPSPYTEQTGGLTERREPASRPASPVRTGLRVPRSRPPPVPGTHAMALRPSSVPLRVPLPPPPESSLPSVPDPESDRAHAASPTVSCLLATIVTDPSFESTAASALVAELVDFTAACRLDCATALVTES